jgi:hypothetical protein
VHEDAYASGTHRKSGHRTHALPTTAQEVGTFLTLLTVSQVNREDGTRGQLERPYQQDDIFGFSQARVKLASPFASTRSSGTGSSSPSIVRTRILSFSFLAVRKVIVQMRILR